MYIMAFPQIVGELSYYTGISNPKYHFDIKKFYKDLETITPSSLDTVDMANVMDDIYIMYIDTLSETMDSNDALIYPDYVYKQWHGKRYHSIYFKYKDDCVFMIFDGHASDNKLNLMGIINGNLHLVANSLHFTSSAEGFVLDIKDIDFKNLVNTYKRMSINFLFEMTAQCNMMHCSP